MRTVPVFSYKNIPFAQEDLKLRLDSDYILQQQIQVLQNYEESIGAYEYISDLDRYIRTNVKKLYIKGNSKKTVPRQAWNIETTSFKTNPQEFVIKYNIEFEEF